MTGEFLVFIGVCVAVSTSPGPAVLYIVARTLDQGTGAGLASMAGITAGGIVHVLLAAFGVAAAAAAWPLSLLLIQLVGAGYLIWLGWQRLRSSARQGGLGRRGAEPLAAIFREGVVVNLTNPKTVLFLLAFLPQFVSPDGGSLSTQLLVLGMTFVLVAAATDSIYVLAAGQLRSRLSAGRAPAGSGYFAGGVYAALGAIGLYDALRQLAPG